MRVVADAPSLAPASAAINLTSTDAEDEGGMRDAIRSTLWEVAARLDAADLPAAVQYLRALHPADQADILAGLNDEDRQLLLQNLEPEEVADFLEFLTPQERADVAPQMEIGSLAAALDETPPETAADVLQDLQKDEAAAVLRAMEERSEVEPLLAHKDESAGGIMTPNVVTLRPHMTAEEAIAYLRALHPQDVDAYYLYVVDEAGHLSGVISLRGLVTAPPDRRVGAFMDPNVITVTTDTDQEEVLQLLQHYNLRAVPVVDAEGRLVGVTTVDDLIDVAQEEATEDMFRLAGLYEGQRVLAPLRQSLRRRVPWLLVNLLTAFAAAAVVALFQDTISRAAALAVFMPVIAGHAGNTGTQAATLVVRGLALGEVSVRDLLAIVRKELAFGLIHGTLVGGLTAALALVLTFNPWLGLVVFIALLLNVISAGILGAAIPLGLKKLGADPALASSVWLTTYTDTFGLVLLLGFGTVLLSHLD